MNTNCSHGRHALSTALLSRRGIVGVYLQTLNTLEREQFSLFMPVELASSLLGTGTGHVIRGDRP